MNPILPTQDHVLLKRVLIVILCVFSSVAVIFSLYVLFVGVGQNKGVSSSQSRGLFTVFIYDYINEVHPQKLPEGHSWLIRKLDFPNDHLAVVEANDGPVRSKLEFIYAIEYPNVRVLKINDLSDRDLQDARLALIRYLNFLKSSDYANAAALYGGPLAALIPYGAPNASVAKLFEGYCNTVSPTRQCLPFAIDDDRREPSDGSYRFTVSYRFGDGSPYISARGAKDFVAIVEFKNDEFKIKTLPFD